MAQTYKSQIMAWGWREIVLDTRADAISHRGDPEPDARIAEYPDCAEGCDAEGHVGSYYLGKHWNLFPSGRFYAPWSATYAWERRKDQAYAVALEAVADKYGGWIESGEGDPTDVYFCRYWPTTPRYN